MTKNARCKTGVLIFLILPFCSKKNPKNDSNTPEIGRDLAAHDVRLKFIKSQLGANINKLPKSCGGIYFLWVGRS